MHQCQHCEGFVPSGLTDCPHCEKSAKIKHRFKRATQLVLGVGATMTLSACYGAAPSNITPCVDPSDKPKTEQSVDPYGGSLDQPCLGDETAGDKSPEPSASPTSEDTQ